MKLARAAGFEDYWSGSEPAFDSEHPRMAKSILTNKRTMDVIDVWENGDFEIYNQDGKNTTFRIPKQMTPVESFIDKSKSVVERLKFSLSIGTESFEAVKLDVGAEYITIKIWGLYFTESQLSRIKNEIRNVCPEFSNFVLTCDASRRVLFSMSVKIASI